MSGRFFRQADDSDSETESSEDELMSSGDEAPKPATKTPMARFLKTADGTDSDSSDDSDSDSDSDDDGKGLDGSDSGESGDERPGVRIISAQEKRLVEMQATGKAMENALKINDWVVISESTCLEHSICWLSRAVDFDRLARMIQRQQNIAEPVPPFYLKTIFSFEGSLNAAATKDKEAKKRMNATNAKALTAMKQKLRKAMKEHEVEITKYNADPEVFERDYAAATAVATAPTPSGTTRGAAGGDQAGTDEFTTVGRSGRAMLFTPESIFKNLQAIQEARGKKVRDGPRPFFAHLVICAEHRSRRTDPHPRSPPQCSSQLVSAYSRPFGSHFFPFRLQFVRCNSYAIGALA